MAANAESQVSWALKPMPWLPAPQGSSMLKTYLDTTFSGPWKEAEVTGVEESCAV